MADEKSSESWGSGAPADEKHIGYWRPNRTEAKPETPQTEVRAFQNDWPGTIGAQQPPGAGFEVDVGIGIALRPTQADGQKPADPPANEAPVPAIVPWEEFDGGNNKHILVLWLDQDVLTTGRQPIGSIVEIRKQLVEMRKGQGFPANGKLVLLGPEDSTMLQAMVREQRDHEDTNIAGGMAGLVPRHPAPRRRRTARHRTVRHQAGRHAAASCFLALAPSRSSG